MLADGTVYAWTEPPFGEALYPGDGGPDCDNICGCLGPLAALPLPRVRPPRAA
ncbi:hypothetical protein GCM10010524_54820 [Streptomyces mexicanus]